LFLASRFRRVTSVVQALRAAILGLLAISCTGCSKPECNTTDLGDEPAEFRLSCGPTDLTKVALSGPCSVGDAGLSTYLFAPASTSLYVTSPVAGDCHVILTFATGFIFSADVSFTLTQTEACGAFASFTVPTQSIFMVDNPSSTCVDAGR
jgi:hypothetical protein